MQEAEPHMGGLTLAAYLLEPVQRLPRYIMLLGDLLKRTSFLHPDHTALKVCPFFFFFFFSFFFFLFAVCDAFLPSL